MTAENHASALLLRVNALETRVAELEREKALRDNRPVEWKADRPVRLAREGLEMRLAAADELVTSLREENRSLTNRIHALNKDRDQVAEHEDAKLDALNEINKILEPFRDEIDERRG